MADSEISTPLPNSFLMPDPTRSHAHVQPSETSASPVYQQPNFTNYSSLSYETGGYHPFYPAQHSTHMPDSTQGPTSPFHYHQNRLSHHHFFSHSTHRGPTFYPPPIDLFTHGLNSNVQPRPFHNMPMPLIGSSHPHHDFSDTRPEIDMFQPSMSMPGGVPTFTYPGYPHFTPPQMHASGPFPVRNSNDIPASHPVQQPRFNGDGPLAMNQGRILNRASNPPNLDQPRQLSSPHRRPSYDRPHVLPGPGGPDRRPQPFVSAHSRRSDRSVSPRTSHRRSFDRYSTDLHPSSNPVDPDEPAAVRARLAHRRNRERRFVRHFTVDDTTPTHNQMQILKDKLRHFLPTELPEDSSTCCDICQKDYSTKHCLPTDEEEVAIQLPCKHIFGEHCINTWFDTCKAHKNKITCPMCRKLLIESARPPPTLIQAVPEVISFIARGGQGMSMSQVGQQSFMRMTGAGTGTGSRALEGDFAVDS